MTKPTLLIISLGELGTALLEGVARSDLFERIVVASRSVDKAQARANNAMIGAGIEGFFPRIDAASLDVDAPGAVQVLRDIAPDVIFTAPSMLPWWKLDGTAKDMPFASFTALHLALMLKFRDLIAAADTGARWIGASFPDVINAVLNRSGFGPDCGIGNVQEPIPKLQAAVAQYIGCAPDDVRIRMVAQHAFEYYVLSDSGAETLPPYLLHATAGGKDVTDLAEKALRAPFPFPYDLHFNRVTASAGLMALRALIAPEPTPLHLPGIGKLIGGYPVMANRERIALDLPDIWTLDQAVATNEASLPWDGIQSVEHDGTITFTSATRDALRGLTGQTIDTLSPANAAGQAKTILAAL